VTEISSTIFYEENKALLNFVIRRMRQGKQYIISIEGLEDPKPQIRTNPLMRPITEEMIARINNESPRFSRIISEEVGSNLDSSVITYYCFVYNILDDFGYRYFEGEDGKTITLSPTSFSKIFNLRRATLQQELNLSSKSKASRGKKYNTRDTSYRCLKLDDYKESENDSEDLKSSIKQLRPIYNGIIDTILII
jgi:hypothetical protein